MIFSQFGRQILILAFLSIGLLFKGPNYEITGLVKTQTGKPIANVGVFASNEHVKTDNEGRFRLSKSANVLHFDHPEFRRSTKIIDPSSSVVEVTLDALSSEDRTVPICATPDQGMIEVWGKLFLPIPKDADYTQGKDIDYQLTRIWPRQNPKGNSMEIWIGLNAVAQFPPDKLLTQAKEFTESTWNFQVYFGRTLLDDFKGQNRDGTYWRFTQSFDTTLLYDNASLKEATLFNQVIDGICVGQR